MTTDFDFIRNNWNCQQCGANITEAIMDNADTSEGLPSTVEFECPHCGQYQVWQVVWTMPQIDRVRRVDGHKATEAGGVA